MLCVLYKPIDLGWQEPPASLPTLGVLQEQPPCSGTERGHLICRGARSPSPESEEHASAGEGWDFGKPVCLVGEGEGMSGDLLALR